MPAEFSIGEFTDNCSTYSDLTPYGFPKIWPGQAGADSVVYRYGEWVVKSYVTNPEMNPISMEQLLLYQQVTNRASEMDLDNGWFGPYALVRVNPIGQICRFNNKLMSVSLCIDGTNLQRERFGFTNSQINTGASLLNRYLNRSLGVHGINIIDRNIMCIPGEDSFEFIVTDLCSVVRRLRTSSI